jgi:hypothetical protein
MRRILLLLFLTSVLAGAQESPLGADFRREGEQFNKSCAGFKSIAGCAELLFTGNPLHIAVGSIAPQNGFAAGPAFVTHLTPSENWRLKWDVDTVASANGSWRAGAYMTIVRTAMPPIKVTTGTPKKSPGLRIHEYPVFNLYAQAISLNKIDFFGLGPSTIGTGRSFFGMGETIAGANAIWPVAKTGKLNLSLRGELNGRFVNIRGDHSESSPSIEQLYSPATAPGLTTQPATLQFGEGLRIKPTLFSDFLKLNYLINFQQFVASNSIFSFRRITVDLSHEIPLYRKVSSPDPKETNGPDECGADVTKLECPSFRSTSRNRQGTLGARLLISESIASGGSLVPFYFQPTLGGSDINGNPSLSSFQDYRFRGPNLLLLHESFEHSLWGPLGFAFMADQGKVALTRGDIEFQHLRHSFASGLTLRAGGLPAVFLLFAWGGNEGTHTIGSLNTSLLGGSTRPSLY